MGETLRFVTSNRGKYEEFRRMGSRFGVEIEMVEASYREIQSDDLEEIALDSCRQLAGSLGEGFFLEDAGLFVDSLGGFPGPFSSYVYSTIGNDGILRLLEGEQNRRARFVSVICHFDGEYHLFRGEVAGEISTEKRGEAGFGFDPIFIPEGHTRTFAEMGPKKDLISHRARSSEIFFRTLAEGSARCCSG